MNPFEHVRIDAHRSLATGYRIYVFWSISKQYVQPGPWRFRLERRQSLDDADWVAVAEVVDQPWAYDAQPPSTPHEVQYRIILTPGRGEPCVSEPYAASSTVWNRHDARIAREIIRRERLYAKRAAIPGYLLKRRVFGDPCPCVDAATRLPTDSQCPICYGVGIRGGFYDPIEMPIIPLGAQTSEQFTERTGYASEAVLAARVILDATVAPHDIWVHAQTHAAYEIGPQIKALASVRGVDIVGQLTLSDLGQGHIIQKYLTDHPLPMGTFRAAAF